MKRIGLFILSIISIFFIGNFTQAKDYEYSNLDITANVLIDGTIDIKEKFTANFFAERHGIIRDIPLNYSVGGKDFHIEVSNIDVEGKNFTTNRKSGNIEIKIGDANRTIIGEQNYPISYSTYGLIRNFSGMGYAELYRNLVGYTFDTNINKVRAEIILPKTYTGFTADDFLITTNGKTKTIDGFDGNVDRSKGNRIIITHDKGLRAYQGITLAIKFPNDYFKFNHENQAKLAGHIGNNYDSTGFGCFFNIQFIVSLCLGLTIAIIVIFWEKIDSQQKRSKIRMRIKLHKGKLKGKYAKMFPVIIQYDPPKRDGVKNFNEIGLISNTKKDFHYKGLNPAEVGLLLHRKAKAKDLFALIYKRAYEKLVEIKFDKDDSIIINRLTFPPEYYPEYEKQFFTNLMKKSKISITKNTNLFNKLNLKEFEAYGVEKGWLKNRSTEGIVKKLMSIIFTTIAVVFLVLIFSVFVIRFFDLKISNCLSTILGYLLTGMFIFLLFSFIIMCICLGIIDKYKETEKGAELIAHILGYREFLAKCDENKLRLFLQQDPLYFDKILPYAIVFGLNTELIKKIEPIMQEMNIKSSWYNGDMNNINIINSTISSVASHSEYSSSNGYSSGSSFDSGGSSFDSGGGGGGGGGTSW